jgi:putative tryptophan/tyrosine transport system substrate-binding protein
MRRRECITLLGGAAAWPLAAGAQQPAMPIIGFLRGGSPGPVEHLMAVFRQTLAEAGYIEGRNVALEIRSAEGQYDRLPAMANELVRSRVAVIVAIPTPAALAAKAATATIPIVFGVPDDPVKLGLVDSLARPNSNATGIGYFLAELGSKQLGLLHELIPAAARIGLLVNANNKNTGALTRDLTAAGSAIGLQIDVVQASNSREIEAALATLVGNRVDALLVATDSFFYSRRVQIATLAARHAIPAVYGEREYKLGLGRLWKSPERHQGSKPAG